MFAKRGSHAPYMTSVPLRLSPRHLGICLFPLLFVIGLLQVLHPLLGHTQSNLGNKIHYIEREPSVCFVVRTYWRHGSEGDNSLPELLKSLKRSPYQRWQALMVVMDGRPFTDLAEIVRGPWDGRVSVYAQMTGPEFAIRNAKGEMNPNFHNHLYILTDLAIQACSPDTQWVVVTNGDNLFDLAFLPTLASIPDSVDLVAMDYYSRYLRPTAPPCDRFRASPALPACKENEVRFCQTDLTANALRWSRFMSEKRSFGAVEGSPLGLNDAILIESLMRDGWKVHRVSGRCLVDHAPSPQMCAMHGGVWDDSNFNSFEGSGGSCITKREAESRLMVEGPLKPLEMVELNVTHDPAGSFGMDPGPITLRCLRRPFTHPWKSLFYPPQCASRVDADT